MRRTLEKMACMVCIFLLVPPGMSALAGTAEKIEADAREVASDIRDGAVEVGHTAVETGKRIKEGTVEAGEAVKEGAKNVGQEIKKAFHETKEAITEKVTGGDDGGSSGDASEAP